ncbi:MAG: hypothetical protein E7317_07015 [Clostridiales bacterium]|nr:hypothetical protein [Clostridiales bacterium]
MARLHIDFYSYTLGHGVDILMTLPTLTPCDMAPGVTPTHVPPAKFPVLYLLHGHGNDYQCWTRYTSVERLAEEQRIAVVTFNGENKAYNDLPGDDRYEAFLNEELPELITADFPISARREDTYIAGLSMGGYGTLAHAFRHPERYCAYGAMSAAPSIRERRAAQGSPWAELFGNAIEPLEEAEARVREGAALPKGYICCGTEDFLYPQNVRFVKALKALGVEFTWHPVEGYAHEWRYWDIEIANFLDWIPRTDYYADKPHKV